MLVRRATTTALVVNAFAGCGRRPIVDLIKQSGLPLEFGTRDATVAADTNEWPDQRDGLAVLAEPMPREDWSRRSRPGDRAVVVVRDPRDLAAIQALTGRGLPVGLSRREALIASVARLKGQERMLRSWAGRSTSSTELVVTYEEITTNPEWFISSLSDFLDLPGLRRRPTLFGEPEPLRVAVEGDDHIGVWREVFDADIAETFELLLPGLVAELGYTDDDHWPRNLDAVIGVDTEAEPTIVLTDGGGADLEPADSDSDGGTPAPQGASRGLFERRPAAR